MTPQFLKPHRVQRSEVRAERLVFLAKDNRHNLLRTCVTRVTYIVTAGQITVGSFFQYGGRYGEKNAVQIGFTKVALGKFIDQVTVMYFIW